MLAALHSWRAETNSTPASTSAWLILKLAVPSRPKHRRAPPAARARGRVATKASSVSSLRVRSRPWQLTHKQVRQPSCKSREQKQETEQDEPQHQVGYDG